MAEKPVAKDVIAQKERAFEAFRNFVTRANDHDAILRREKIPSLPPELIGSIAPVPYLSALYEEQVHESIAVLRMNPTLIDAMGRKSGSRAENWERDIMVYLAWCWLQLNKGRKWDGSQAEGQVRYGVGISRLCWDYGEEPEDYDDRDEWMKSAPFGFHMKYPPVLSAGWLPVQEDEIDAFWCHYKLPVIEASEKLARKDGMKPTIDSAGKLQWLGSEEIPDESVWQKHMDVYVRDARDPKNRKCPVEGHDHYMRVVTEFVVAEGGKATDMEEVDSYDSPLGVCSFFVTPGRLLYSDTDPARRYRPFLYNLLVEIDWSNYLETTLATAARRDSSERIYIDLSKVPPHVALPEGGELLEYPKPDPAGNTVAAYPGPVLAYPSAASPLFVDMLTESRRRVEAAKVSRWTTGGLDPTDADAPATNVQIQTQQAALPFDQLLGASDASITAILGAILHAIEYWDAVGPKGRRYYCRTTGQESVARGSTKSGDEVYVTAEKVRYVQPDIFAKTAADTMAESAQRWMQVKDKYLAGAASVDDLIEGGGYHDTETQKEKLYKDRVQRQMDSIETPMVGMALASIAQALTGIDFSMALPMGGMGGAPPTGGPAQLGAPSPQALTGQFMHAPPLDGVQGGSSPVGAMA